jgi:hypothetical protein
MSRKAGRRAATRTARRGITTDQAGPAGAKGQRGNYDAPRRPRTRPFSQTSATRRRTQRHRLDATGSGAVRAAHCPTRRARVDAHSRERGQPAPRAVNRLDTMPISDSHTGTGSSPDTHASTPQPQRIADPNGFTRMGDNTRSAKPRTVPRAPRGTPVPRSCDVGHEPPGRHGHCAAIPEQAFPLASISFPGSSRAFANSARTGRPRDGRTCDITAVKTSGLT